MIVIFGFFLVMDMEVFAPVRTVQVCVFLIYFNFVLFRMLFHPFCLRKLVCIVLVREEKEGEEEVTKKVREWFAKTWSAWWCGTP